MRHSRLLSLVGSSCIFLLNAVLGLDYLQELCIFQMMFEASSSEFPFVAGLPKREKSAVGRAVDVVREFAALCDQHGPLLPVALVAPMLNISNQRVHQLIEGGRFPGAVKFRRYWFIPEASLIEFAKSEKSRGGRPRSASFSECLESARDMLNVPRKNS